MSDYYFHEAFGDVGSGEQCASGRDCDFRELPSPEMTWHVGLRHRRDNGVITWLPAAAAAAAAPTEDKEEKIREAEMVIPGG